VDAIEFVIGTLEPETAGAKGHCHRVSRFAESIWESLHLPAQEMQDIRLAALLHELGGPQNISAGDEAHTHVGGSGCECEAAGHASSGSTSPAHGGGCRCARGSACTTAELRINAGIGGNGRRERLSLLLDRLKSSHQLRFLDCLCHLGERYDGRGGPLGLRGDQIPLEARIVAVADAFDRCLCSAPGARPVERAIDSLRSMSGSSLDPNLVEALVRQIVTGQVRLG
jgi:hypothetical protein